MAPSVAIWRHEIMCHLQRLPHGWRQPLYLALRFRFGSDGFHTDEVIATVTSKVSRFDDTRATLSCDRFHTVRHR
jgi:hypothetical protein